MGYIRHHAILVTASNRQSGAAAHATAMELFSSATPSMWLGGFERCITPLQESPCEGRYSFAILPDCSKEGWPESDFGDSMREAFKAWMRTTPYEVLSGDLDWAEVQYGDDEGMNFVRDTDRQDTPTTPVAL